MSPPAKNNKDDEFVDITDDELAEVTVGQRSGRVDSLHHRTRAYPCPSSLLRVPMHPKKKKDAKNPLPPNQRPTDATEVSGFFVFRFSSLPSTAPPPTPNTMHEHGRKTVLRRSLSTASGIWHLASGVWHRYRAIPSALDAEHTLFNA